MTLSVPREFLTLRSALVCLTSSRPLHWLRAHPVKTGCLSLRPKNCTHQAAEKQDRGEKSIIQSLTSFTSHWGAVELFLSGQGGLAA